MPKSPIEDGQNSPLRVVETNDLVAYKVQVLAGLINRRASVDFRRHLDLTIWEARTIARVGSEPRINLLDLAAQLRLDKGQISRVVTELALRGLVERQKAGRMVQLTLTPAGRETLDKFSQLAARHDAEYTEDLPSDQQRWFKDTLDGLIVKVAGLSESDRSS